MLILNEKLYNSLYMRQILIFLVIVVALTGCGNSGNGELLGVQGRPEFYHSDPYGMSYVPLGSFTMGASDQDVPYAQIHHPKTVTVSAFYMDETEITNNEYRSFVNWVRDSLAHTILGETQQRDVFGDHYVIDKETGEPKEFGVDEPYKIINWKQKIDWDGKDLPANETNPLEEMFLPEAERFWRMRQIDTRKLYYRYWEMDLRKAAQKKNRWQHHMENGEYTGDLAQGSYNDEITNDGGRKAFIKQKVVPVYPDTLCWIWDYTYSYNEPWTVGYFAYPAYDNYPVVGVNWTQAKAFSIWRSQLRNNYLLGQNEPKVHEFRLPTEAEWEFAARGGYELSAYPWGGPYTRNINGCFVANFKPMRGNYSADGGSHPLIVAHYTSNFYGLYDMSGNVSEWTVNAYDETAYSFTWDLNPAYTYESKHDDAPVKKRKVVRGGSWKDIAYYLQVSTRNYEYQDSATSYIGFRNVQDYMGRQKDDNPARSSEIYQ